MASVKFRIDPNPYRTTRTRTWVEIRMKDGRWEPFANLYLSDMGAKTRCPEIVKAIEKALKIKIPKGTKEKY